MNMPAPIQLKAGDYVMNFPQERDGDRNTARDVMKRNGCRSIRFELHENKVLIAHGYVGRLSGPGVEDL